MISGFLALIAASFTIGYLHKQISQTEKIEKDRLRRQMNAARSTLPLTLAGLCASIREIISCVYAAKSPIRFFGYTQNNVFPSLPVQHISELQLVISSTDNDTVSEPISEIIREMQTLWSRIEILNNRTEQERRAGLLHEVNTYLVQAAKIHALTESLFEFSRRQSEDGPNEVSWERVSSIFLQLNVLDEDLNQLIKEGIEQSPHFWVLK
ncbi:MAG TPA: hypothetical protein PKA59_08565 [Chakrabartia sp.]|jgi:hypothetical protein|nr:hypothetical protein [Chakrabartia sp.]